MAKENLKTGDVINDRYRIVEILGHGGFAFIYIAERLEDGTEVIIKSLHHLAAKHDPTVFERFRREAAIASDLRHPNIVTTIDYGRMESGKLYLVMERIHGEPLDEVMKRGALPSDQVRRLLHQLLSALAAAHAKNIVHRDLKPTNILLWGDPAGGSIKVIDFGLAKVLEGTDPSVMETLTAMGTVVGTPGYIAPEVLHGKAVTPQADIYAAGIIGYELLTGHVAYTGKALERVQKQAKHNPERPPPPLCDDPVFAVVEKLMARELPHRYPDASYALGDLEFLEKRARPWWKFWG